MVALACSGNAAVADSWQAREVFNGFERSRTPLLPLRLIPVANRQQILVSPGLSPGPCEHSKNDVFVLERN